MGTCTASSRALGHLPRGLCFALLLCGGAGEADAPARSWRRLDWVVGGLLPARSHVTPDASLQNKDGLQVTAPGLLLGGPFSGLVQNWTVAEPGIQSTANLLLFATAKTSTIQVLANSKKELVGPTGKVAPIELIANQNTTVRIVVDAVGDGCPGAVKCQRIYYLNITRGFDPTGDCSLAEIQVDPHMKYGKAKLIPSPFVNSPSVSTYIGQEAKNATTVIVTLKANQTKARVSIGRQVCAPDPHQCEAEISVGSREKIVTVLVTSPNGKERRSYDITVGKGGAGSTAPDDDYWEVRKLITLAQTSSRVLWGYAAR
jgi:hypothetical protein